MSNKSIICFEHMSSLLLKSFVSRKTLSKITDVSFTTQNTKHSVTACKNRMHALLLLCRWSLFNHYARCGNESCVSVICSTVPSGAVSNVKCNIYMPCWYVLAVTLNLSVMMTIVSCSVKIDDSLDGHGTRTFTSVESKIPA